MDATGPLGKRPLEEGDAQAKRQRQAVTGGDPQQQEPGQQQQPEAAAAVDYFPTTRCPLGGWFQPCRYCRSWTSGLVPTLAGDVAVCNRCQVKLAHYCQAYLSQHLTALSGSTAGAQPPLLPPQLLPSTDALRSPPCSGGSSSCCSPPSLVGSQQAAESSEAGTPTLHLPLHKCRRNSVNSGPWAAASVPSPLAAIAEQQQQQQLQQQQHHQQQLQQHQHQQSNYPHQQP